MVGDTTDKTRSVIDAETTKIENGKGIEAFNSCTIVLKNLSNVRSQDVAARHGFGAQVEPRKRLAIVRYAFLQKTINLEHEWVSWRDVDIAESPRTILEDFIAHQKDDYNSWQETPQNDNFKERLDTEVIVVEAGYSQFKTRRRHMAKSAVSATARRSRFRWMS
ncbi:MAG: hypothetical protein Q9191_004657 [Dirinaria sp. TL-2023a]